MIVFLKIVICYYILSDKEQLACFPYYPEQSFMFYDMSRKQISMFSDLDGKNIDVFDMLRKNLEIV